MKRYVLALSVFCTGFLSSNSVVLGDPAAKVTICHEAGPGEWVILEVPVAAVQAHLSNHDDGFPNFLTFKSSTPLDGNCETLEAR